MKKIISTVLAACMLFSITACNNASSNRETILTGDTMDTVNPDISEPNQSIPSDAMITESETETETSVTVGYNNTYKINGVSYTISRPIEEFVYTLPGSDMKFINIDEFMEAYGFEVMYVKPYRMMGDGIEYIDYYRCAFKNQDEVSIKFMPEINGGDHNLWHSGLDVCQEIVFFYPSDFPVAEGAGPYQGIAYVEDEEGNMIPETKYKYKTVRRILLTNDSDISNTEFYGVNGIVSDGEIKVNYGFTLELLVALAVILDALNETGVTAPASESLCRVCTQNTTVNSSSDYDELFLLTR